MVLRQTITGGIKSRLGHNSSGVKSRLGKGQCICFVCVSNSCICILRLRFVLLVSCVSGRGELDSNEEYNSEEELLRKSAIKTLDLRGRIDGKTVVERKVVETDSQEDGDGEEEVGGKQEVRRKDKIQMREQKIQKLLRKQEMDKLLYKAEKKHKKKEKVKLKSQVAAVLNSTQMSRKEPRRLVSGRILEELPSASDYSDLESPNEGEK